MLSVASTRTGPKSSAIITAPGEYPCCQIDRIARRQGKRRAPLRHEGRRVKAAKPVDAGNAAGLAVSSRFAAPPLRSGPSGDTASPAAQRLMTTGRVLPVVTDRLFDDGHPTVFDDRLTRRNPERGFDSPRASDPSEYALFRASGCPKNQDRRKPCVARFFGGGCPGRRRDAADAAPERGCARRPIRRGRRTSRPGFTPPSARRRATTAGPAPAACWPAPPACA